MTKSQGDKQKKDRRKKQINRAVKALREFLRNSIYIVD